MTAWSMPQSRFQVPVFPLPKLVMFPGTMLPLHIFDRVTLDGPGRRMRVEGR